MQATSRKETHPFQPSFALGLLASLFSLCSVACAAPLNKMCHGRESAGQTNKPMGTMNQDGSDKESSMSSKALFAVHAIGWANTNSKDGEKGRLHCALKVHCPSLTSQQTSKADTASFGWGSAPESGWIGEVIGVVGAEGVACTLPVYGGADVLVR